MAQLLFFSLEDNTPQISYWPPTNYSDDPDPSTEWATYYFSDSGFYESLGDAAYGTSHRITSKDGATVSFDFHGTGFQLLGNAFSASYSVVLDGETLTLPCTSNSQGILAERTGLPNRNHSVTLVAHTTASTSSIVFDKAIITSPSIIDRIPSGSTTRKYPRQSTRFIGDWSTAERSFRESRSTYHHSQAVGDRTRVSFTGSHVFLSGISSPSAGIFSVTLDRNITTTLSATSRYTNPDTLLYYATGLDPHKTHELEVTNEDGSALYLRTDGLTVVPYDIRGYPMLQSRADGQPDSGSSGYPAGTVAALSLAGVLIFLILTSTLFYIFVYRPRKRRRAQERRSAQEENKFDGLHQLPHFRDSSSRRRGFENWRREVELGLGLGALANLGLAFRHSSSEGARSRGNDYDDEYDEYADDAPLSSKSGSTGTSGRARRTAAKGKMKAFASSWTQRTKSPESYSLSPPRSDSSHSHRSEGSMTHDSLYFAPIYKGKLMQPPGEQATYRLSGTGSLSHPYAGGVGVGGALRPLPPIAIPVVNVQAPTTEGGSTPRSQPMGNVHPTHLNKSGEANASFHSPQNSDEWRTSRASQPLLFPQMPGHGGSNRDSLPVNELDSFRATQDALRSLSPRTSEVIPRITRSSGASRSHHRPDPQHVVDVSSKILPQIPSDRPRSTAVLHPSLDDGSVDMLDLRDDSTADATPKTEELPQPQDTEPDHGNGRGKRASGLSVRFQEQVQDINEAEARKKSQGEPIAVPVQGHPPGAVLKPFAKSRHLAGAASSFLDLDSSSSGGSTRSPSNGSSLAPSRREVSRWSNTTESHSVPSVGRGLESHWSSTGSPATQASDHQQQQQQVIITRPTHSQNDSSESAAASPLSSTGNPFPYPISLPPSPHHPAHILQIQQSQAAAAIAANSGSGGNNRSQLGLLSGTGNTVYLQPTELTSPTDSIPMTISEMHFRQSFSEDVHDLELRDGSHLPPHPRLPLGGPEDDDERGRSPLTGTSSHAFLVQRVLGYNGNGNGHGTASGTPKSPLDSMRYSGTPKPPS